VTKFQISHDERKGEIETRNLIVDIKFNYLIHLLSFSSLAMKINFAINLLSVSKMGEEKGEERIKKHTQ
jgi:hypothetical protein